MSNCPIVHRQVSRVWSGKGWFLEGGLQLLAGGLIPGFLGGHRDCQLTGAPKSATALAASRASWPPPSSVCPPAHWLRGNRRCSVFLVWPDAFLRPVGLLLRLFPNLHASGASTGEAQRAGGPRSRQASLIPGKEEGGACHLCHSPEVSGTQAEVSGTLPPRPRPCLLCCLRTRMAQTWLQAAWTPCHHPGCGECCRHATQEGGHCTVPQWSPSESSEWPECYCPALWGSLDIEANSGISSLEKGNRASVAGSYFQKCLHRNLEPEKQELGLVWTIALSISALLFSFSLLLLLLKKYSRLSATWEENLPSKTSGRFLLIVAPVCVATPRLSQA